jgi:release factor glutamine methyltransferase
MQAKARTIARRYTKDIKTYENALAWGQAALGMLPNGKNEARIIMSYATGLSSTEMITRAKELMRDDDFAEFEKRIYSRIEGVPLQYIVGIQEFMGLPIRVNPSVLIPRLDTEILVEYARANIPNGEHFIDLCTGSGCVAISTLTGTKNTTCEAIDISVGALDLATKNATLNGVDDRIEFIRADVLSMPLGKDKPYAVLSNPPYVTEAEYGALEKELYFEPKIALVGADMGLEFYKAIVPLYKNRIKDEGFIAFEIGKDQAAALTAISAEEGMQIEIIKDYGGHDRVAVLTHSK